MQEIAEHKSESATEAKAQLPKPRIEEAKAQPPKPRIVVDYTSDMRRGRIFHLIDSQGREVALSQQDARDIARSILKIIRGKE